MARSKRNVELAKKIKGQPCVICGQPGEGDHIKNYAGDSRKDIEENVWPLCRSHHVAKGTMGLNTFVNNFSLHNEMIKRGFEWDDFYNGWLKKF